jgi:hypothetical protein
MKNSYFYKKTFPGFPALWRFFLRFLPQLPYLPKISLLVIFLSLGRTVFPQQTDPDIRPEIENLLENYFSEDETKDVEQLLNELQILRDHPLDINKAGETELASLHFLDPVQIRALLDYREKYGQILSEYELASIPGFDTQLARLTGYFAVFDQDKLLQRKKYGRHEVLVRTGRLLEKQAGFKEPEKYEGSPDRFYLRYRYTSSSLNAGLTGEKDPGESFFRASNQTGFDFYSGFIQINSVKGRWTAILGDYTVQFGQGLVAWQGFSLGKSAESTRIGNIRQGTRPHTSSDENNFMRGTAVTFHTGRFRFTSFFSLKNFDANISQADGARVFTSFQTSGYHRTTGEIEDKHAVQALTAGGHARYEAERISVGLTGIHVNYQYPLVRKDEAYNQFLFKGNEVTNLSIDYRYGINRLYLFGELATNLEQGFAGTTGMMYQPIDQVGLSSVFRSIGKHYSSPLASAFAESNQINDEHGFYLGARILPVAKISLNMYMDFFRFNHIKYTTASAGSGKEFLFQINYVPDKNWQVYGRYFYECKPVKISGTYSKKNIDQVRQSLRFNLTGEVNPSMTIKTRFEQSFFKHDHYSYGFFIGQDVGFHPEKWPANIWGRVAYFKTGDYDSRIYAYENDLLYQFSVPALYGEGIRSYLTGKVKICEKVELWYKLSRTWFFGVQSISSGNSLIMGNKRTEVKFQIRFRI